MLHQIACCLQYVGLLSFYILRASPIVISGHLHISLCSHGPLTMGIQNSEAQGLAVQGCFSHG
jgi:hypothetical protein